MTNGARAATPGRSGSGRGGTSASHWSAGQKLRWIRAGTRQTAGNLDLYLALDTRYTAAAGSDMPNTSDPVQFTRHTFRHRPLQNAERDSAQHSVAIDSLASR